MPSVKILEGDQNSASAKPLIIETPLKSDKKMSVEQFGRGMLREKRSTIKYFWMQSKSCTKEREKSDKSCLEHQQLEQLSQEERQANLFSRQKCEKQDNPSSSKTPLRPNNKIFENRVNFDNSQREKRLISNEFSSQDEVNSPSGSDIVLTSDKKMTVQTAYDKLLFEKRSSIKNFWLIPNEEKSSTEGTMAFAGADEEIIRDESSSYVANVRFGGKHLFRGMKLFAQSFRAEQNSRDNKTVNIKRVSKTSFNKSDEISTDEQTMADNLTRGSESLSEEFLMGNEDKKNSLRNLIENIKDAIVEQIGVTYVVGEKSSPEQNLLLSKGSSEMNEEVNKSSSNCKTDFPMKGKKYFIKDIWSSKKVLDHNTSLSSLQSLSNENTQFKSNVFTKFRLEGENSSPNKNSEIFNPENLSNAAEKNEDEGLTNEAKISLRSSDEILCERRSSIMNFGDEKIQKMFTKNIKNTRMGSSSKEVKENEETSKSFSRSSEEKEEEAGKSSYPESRIENVEHHLMPEHRSAVTSDAEGKQFITKIKTRSSLSKEDMKNASRNFVVADAIVNTVVKSKDDVAFAAESDRAKQERSKNQVENIEVSILTDKKVAADSEDVEIVAKEKISSIRRFLAERNSKNKMPRSTDSLIVARRKYFSRLFPNNGKKSEPTTACSEEEMSSPTNLSRSSKTSTKGDDVLYQDNGGRGTKEAEKTFEGNDQISKCASADLKGKDASPKGLKKLIILSSSLKNGSQIREFQGQITDLNDCETLIKELDQTVSNGEGLGTLMLEATDREDTETCENVIMKSALNYEEEAKLDANQFKILALDASAFSAEIPKTMDFSRSSSHSRCLPTESVKEEITNRSKINIQEKLREEGNAVHSLVKAPIPKCDNDTPMVGDLEMQSIESHLVFPEKRSSRSKSSTVSFCGIPDSKSNHVNGNEKRSKPTTLGFLTPENKGKDDLGISIEQMSKLGEIDGATIYKSQSSIMVLAVPVVENENSRVNTGVETNQRFPYFYYFLGPTLDIAMIDVVVTVANLVDKILRRNR